MFNYNELEHLPDVPTQNLFNLELFTECDPLMFDSVHQESCYMCMFEQNILCFYIDFEILHRLFLYITFYRNWTAGEVSFVYFKVVCILKRYHFDDVPYFCYSSVHYLTIVSSILVHLPYMDTSFYVWQRLL